MAHILILYANHFGQTRAIAHPARVPPASPQPVRGSPPPVIVVDPGTQVQIR